MASNSNHLEHNGTKVTVDIILIFQNKVLLIKRGKEPFKNTWAFPGGRVDKTDKDTLTAAQRELKEETNLSGLTLEYFKKIGNATRDPRGFTETNVFIVKLSDIPKNLKAGDDAVEYHWYDLNNLPNMAFDHKDILTQVINEKLKSNTN